MMTDGSLPASTVTLPDAAGFFTLVTATVALAVEARFSVSSVPGVYSNKQVSWLSFTVPSFKSSISSFFTVIVS